MRIDVHIHSNDDSTLLLILQKLKDFSNQLNEVLTKENQIMATLDDVLNDVTAESTVIDSISTLVSGLKQQLADALSGANLPPAVQSKVDAVFAQAESNKAKLATAVTDNTPVENQTNNPSPNA